MTKLIPILSGRCYVVELPEGATNLQVVTIHQGSKTFPSLKYDRPDLVRGYIDLPPGSWQIDGFLSDVNWDESDIESLESAILAEGYGFHSEPEPSYSDCEQYENPMRTYEGRLREWNSKQSRVLCRERCLILKRN